MTHLLVHYAHHQQESGFAHQVADALLKQAHDPGERQDHLDSGVLFAGEPAELLHGSLLVDLVSFLHSDSPFFGEKFP
jgi:hypothetical protein